jgi:hypothetical protein
LAALSLLIALLFDAAVLLPAALTGLFAAARARTAVPPAELLRFRFGSFNVSFFIFPRIPLRATRTLDAGLLLPTRFRAPDDGASFATRFVVDVDFALDTGPTFFAFDFVVFFDLTRAAIATLSTCKVRVFAHALPCTNHYRFSKTASGLCLNESAADA